MGEHKQFRQAILRKHPGAEIHVIIPVLWYGWECDGAAAVISQGGAPFIVTTDHGTLVRVESSFLKDKLIEYWNTIAKTEMAISMVEERKLL